jgi:glucose-1-phosphate cytidylyltransferase
LKAVILAGNSNSRITEETGDRPTTMVDIGGKPMLWHILKAYSAHELNDFIVCCGYKGYLVKEYFANYFLHMSDITIDLQGNEITVHQHQAEPWRVTVVDTGEDTKTGGQLKRVAKYLKAGEDFCLTTGDIIAAIDVRRHVAFHREHGKSATVLTVARSDTREAVELSFINVREHGRARAVGSTWRTAGFFILSPEVVKLIEGDSTDLEAEPLEQLAAAGDLAVYPHHDFWQPMDSLRDRTLLESLWTANRAPWKAW